MKKAKTVVKPKNTNKIGIYDMLTSSCPPAHDAVVVYGISRRGDRINLLHSERCLGAQQVYSARLVETLALNLQQDLKNRRITTICRECLGLDHEFATKLAANARMLEKGLKTAQGTDRSLLLYCEAWKPGNVNEWVNWLYGETPEQIRKKARNIIGWKEPSDENQVVYFGAYGFDDMSWVMAAEEHVSVPRVLGLASSIAVHGLLPQNMWETYGKRLSKTNVAVGPEFTKTHLELAVSLFEESLLVANTQRPDSELLNAFAKKAVETAQLCLA